MRSSIRQTLVALGCLAPALLAWTPATVPPIALTGQSRLWVNGTSTARAFECSATTMTADAEITAAKLAPAFLAGEKPVKAAQLVIPASALDCKNGTMNEHMRKAIKAKDYPTISFKITSYEVKPGASAPSRATGELTMGGVTRPITVDAVATQAPDGSLHLVGSKDVVMTEWKLEPPKLFMGTMKVNPLVKVSFDLYLKG